MSQPWECLAHAHYVCIYEGEGILRLLAHLDRGGARESIGNFVCSAADASRIPEHVGAGCCACS